MRAWLLRVHHLLGSFAAVLVLFYALTGLLLNHPDTFGLKHRSWATPWLVEHYRLTLPELEWWPAGPHWLVSHDTRLLLDGRPTGEACASIQGTAWWQEKIWISCDGMMLVLDGKGNPVELAYPGDELPDEIQQLGLAEGYPAWSDTTGHTYRLARDNRWAQTRAPLVSSQPDHRIPEGLQSTLYHSLYGRELTPWRVLGDLHSGSFFGNGNKLAGDFTALALIYLAISGLWLYLTRRRRR